MGEVVKTTNTNINKPTIRDVRLQFRKKHSLYFRYKDRNINGKSQDVGKFGVDHCGF